MPQFDYDSNAIQLPLGIGAALFIIGLIAPPLLRLIVLAFSSGPLVWSLLQVLRRGRGVRCEADAVKVFICTTRRTITIPYDQLQGVLVTSRNGLGIAYTIPRNSQPGEDPRPPALRFIVSAALINPLAANQALSAQLPENRLITDQQVLTLWRLRRIRRVILWGLGLFVLLPLALIFLFRTVIAVGEIWR